MEDNCDNCEIPPETPNFLSEMDCSHLVWQDCLSEHLIKSDNQDIEYTFKCLVCLKENKLKTFIVN